MESKRCDDYCCSLFANFVDDELTKTPDLTNHIHPIFRRTNFNGGELSRDDYELLKPSLQLASLFFESESLIPYLVTMFDGKVQTENGITIPRSQVTMPNIKGKLEQVYDVYSAPHPGQGELNDQTRKRASEILTAMGDMVTFNVANDLEEGEGGFTQTVRGRLKGKLGKTFPHGCRSTVSIDDPVGKIRLATDKTRWPAARIHSKDCLASQKELHSGYSKEQRTCQACSIQLELLAARFSLVEVLIHEQGHCLYNAAWGYKQPQGEIPQTRDTIGEAGFEIWSQLIGGSLTIASTPTPPVARIEGACNKGRPRSSGPMAFVEEWPNYGVLERYRAIGYPLGVTQRQPYDDAYHRIPISYVEDLFTQAFWDNVRINGQETMKPPKIATWFFRWSDENETWVRCSTEENRRNINQREVQDQDSSDHKLVEVLDEGLPRGLAGYPKALIKRKRRLSDVGGPDFELRRYAFRL
jgi:hypothetical protein